MPLKHILVLLSITAYAATSYSDPCLSEADVTTDYSELAAIRDRIEESPFMLACKDPPNLLAGRPKTDWFVRSVVEKDSKGLSTRDLLKRVVARAKQRVSESKHQIENISKCMADSSPKCAELKNWVEIELPKFVSEARFNLSLAQSQNEVKTWVGLASPNINAKLDPLGSYKFDDWAPLSHEEVNASSARLATYKSKIDEEARQKIKTREICRRCDRAFSQETLLTIRFQHFQEYHQMLSELPMLQYLKGPKVTQPDIDDAFKKMNRGLENEDLRLDKFGKQLDSKEPLSPDVLDILIYSSLLEEVLLEDNRYCGLASSLVYTSTNRLIGNSIAIGLPVLAVSFYAAPVVAAVGGTAAAGLALGIGTGVVAGASMAIQSFDEFAAARNRTLGHIYGDSLGFDLRDVESKAKRAKYDIVTLPVGFGLSGLALRGLTVGAKSYQTSRKIFRAANE